MANGNDESLDQVPSELQKEQWDRMTDDQKRQYLNSRDQQGVQQEQQEAQQKAQKQAEQAQKVTMITMLLTTLSTFFMSIMRFFTGGNNSEDEE